MLGCPTAENMLFRRIEDRLVLPEDVGLNAAEMFIDPVRLVGPRRWSVCKDVVDPLDTINGVSVPDGGEMRGLEDTKESDPVVPEGRKFSRTATQSAEKHGV